MIGKAWGPVDKRGGIVLPGCADFPRSAAGDSVTNSRPKRMGQQQRAGSSRKTKESAGAVSLWLPVPGQEYGAPVSTYNRWLKYLACLALAV